MIGKLAWKNIWFKPLNTILSVVLLTSSVAIITTLVLVEKQFEDVPHDMVPYKDAQGNIYNFGFGLNWKGVINDARTQKYAVKKK